MCSQIRPSIPKSVSEFVYRLIRGCLYAFTFVLCILGLSLLIFSFWYVYEGKNYHLDNSIKFCVFTVSFLLGAILFSLAACGLAGALNENLFLAKIFFFGSVLLILVELGCIFLIFAYKSQILKHASSLFQKFISEYADDADVRFLVDTIQSDLKCCGISSPSDWDRNPYYRCSSISAFACSVPASCCYNYSMEQPKFNLFCGLGIRKNESISKSYHLIHVTGCKYSIYSFLNYKHKLTSYILTGILVPQIIVVLLVVCFIVSLNYLIQYDLIETESYFNHSESNKEVFFGSGSLNAHDSPDRSNYIVKFDRSNNLEVQTYSKRLEPIETKKNLFILSIGSHNDFLKRSNLYHNRSGSTSSRSDQSVSDSESKKY